MSLADMIGVAADAFHDAIWFATHANLSLAKDKAEAAKKFEHAALMAHAAAARLEFESRCPDCGSTSHPPGCCAQDGHG